MHPAEHGSYVTLPVRLSQWDFNYGPAIDGSTQMSDFQKDDRRKMNKRGIAFIGRAYKIPKVCVIEYLMGEDMCRINLS